MTGGRQRRRLSRFLEAELIGASLRDVDLRDADLHNVDLDPADPKIATYVALTFQTRPRRLILFSRGGRCIDFRPFRCVAAKHWRWAYPLRRCFAQLQYRPEVA